MLVSSNTACQIWGIFLGEKGGALDSPANVINRNPRNLQQEARSYRDGQSQRPSEAGNPSPQGPCSALAHLPGASSPLCSAARPLWSLLKSCSQAPAFVSLFPLLRTPAAETHVARCLTSRSLCTHVPFPEPSVTTPLGNSILLPSRSS